MEETPLPRRQLHGYVSTEDRDGWYDFAKTHGTNVTALMEAFGAVLAQHTETKEERLPPLLKDSLNTSRRIASGRSSRRRE